MVLIDLILLTLYFEQEYKLESRVEIRKKEMRLDNPKENHK